jgi:quercetin dioxygenase-like cupin family protein
MTRYVEPDGLQWTDVDVRGATMSKAPVFEGDYDVRSAFFRMPIGCAVPPHHHAKWVQVMVLEGRMKIEQEGQPDREVAAGGCYFVEADETHAETAIENALVLVTQGEDRSPNGS